MGQGALGIQRLRKSSSPNSNRQGSLWVGFANLYRLTSQFLCRRDALLLKGKPSEHGRYCNNSADTEKD